MSNQLQFLSGVLFISCAILTSTVEGQSIFSKEISSIYADNPMAALLVNNKSAVIFAGQTNENGNYYNSHGMFVGKMDTSGNLLWDKRFDPENTKWVMNPTCILERGYGYLIGGSLDKNKTSASLMKLDANGNFIEYHAIQANLNHLPALFMQSMAFRPDGALIMAGYGGVGHEHSEMIWIKTDETFNSFTVKSIGANKDLSGVKVFAQPDNSTIVACIMGNIYIAGQNDNGSMFPSLIKLDVNGNVVFTKNYKMSFPAKLNDCIQLSDGSFIMVGSGVNESYIEKINSNYKVEWCKSYPLGSGIENDLNFFSSVVQAADGGFLIGGHSYSSGNMDNSDHLLMKTNSNGDATSYITISGDEMKYESLVELLSVSTSRYFAVGVNTQLISPYATTVNAFNVSADLTTSCSALVHSITGSPEVVTVKKNEWTSSDFANSYKAFNETFLISAITDVDDFCAPLREASETDYSNEVMSIIPNPASGDVNILMPADYFKGRIKVEIINVLGQSVAHFQLENNEPVALQVSEWQKGYYLVRSTDEAGKSLVTKLQVQ